MDQAGTPLLMAVDGNSLLHRAHHAHEFSNQRDAQGRPTWGLRGMVALLGRAAARLTPDAVVVAFDCAGDPRRKDDYPQYKAGRPEKPADLATQIAAAPDLLRAAGVPVVQHDGWEADDVLASAAATARGEGWRCCVVTSDRDAFALIDATTTVLRVIAGGIDASPLLTEARMPLLYGIAARQYRDFAAIRGDSSDNLPGVHGVGAKTAARLLATFESASSVYEALDGGRAEDVVAAVGAGAAARLGTPDARANVARNLTLMRMRDDLPVPELAQMRVPLEVVRLQTALRARDIVLNQSLWALTGAPPPGGDHWGWLAEQDDLATPRPTPAFQAARHRPPSEVEIDVAVSIPEPSEQLSLF